MSTLTLTRIGLLVSRISALSERSLIFISMRWLLRLRGYPRPHLCVWRKLSGVGGKEGKSYQLGNRYVHIPIDTCCTCFLLEWILSYLHRIHCQGPCGTLTILKHRSTNWSTEHFFVRDIDRVFELLHILTLCATVQVYRQMKSTKWPNPHSSNGTRSR
jgi:hypothetical protein